MKNKKLNYNSFVALDIMFKLIVLKMKKKCH